MCLIKRESGTLTCLGMVLDPIYFKALPLKPPGYQKFPIVVHNEMEHNLHVTAVFDELVTITFSMCQRTQLILEVRYLANILEPVKMNTINTLLQITRYI